eukprot:10625348-Alexandrium_andersonii.AAC.1
MVHDSEDHCFEFRRSRAGGHREGCRRPSPMTSASALPCRCAPTVARRLGFADALGSGASGA